MDRAEVMIVEFEIDDGTDEKEFVSKVNLEFHLGSCSFSINPDSGKMVLSFDKNIDPNAFHDVCGDFEEFADQEGVDVNVFL